MEIAQTILTALVSSGVTVAVLGFLAKSFLEHQLQKSLESFKFKIQTEHDRTSLKFGVLHEERKRHVIDLYSATVEARSTLNALLAPIQMSGRSLADQTQSAHNSFAKLNNAGVAARLVLTDAEYSAIGEMIDAYWSVYVQAETCVRMARGVEAQLWKHSEADWRQCQTQMKRIEEEQEAAVRDTLRKILGVT